AVAGPARLHRRRGPPRLPVPVGLPHLPRGAHGREDAVAHREARGPPAPPVVLSVGRVFQPVRLGGGRVGKPVLRGRGGLRQPVQTSCSAASRKFSRPARSPDRRETPPGCASDVVHLSRGIIMFRSVHVLTAGLVLVLLLFPSAGWAQQGGPGNNNN